MCAFGTPLLSRGVTGSRIYLAARSAWPQGARLQQKTAGEEGKAVGILTLGRGKGVRGCLRGSWGSSLQGLEAEVSP